MKNALWGNENVFAPLDNFSVTLPVVAGERTSTGCCWGNLCSLALPITAAALDWEDPNGGRTRVGFFFHLHVLVEPFQWQQVGMWPRASGLCFHHCCCRGFAALPDLGPSTRLQELSLYTSLGERFCAAKGCYQCRDQ